jgi:formylglycine-generating enzyme required for sulfatase activity
MVLVEGAFCPFVAHRCQTYLGTEPDAPPSAERPDEARRCQRYRDDLLCEGRPSRLRFCIDRYEYPNLSGVKPAVMVGFRDAERACAAEGKRLCQADEWMFACEGPRTLPYPYGIVRDPGACNIDRRPFRVNEAALSTPRDVALEIERIDQRVASGVLSGCVSAFGVFDLSGNVAEWVRDREDAKGGEWAVAGGHWARAPAVCRRLEHPGPQARSHKGGFRCCRDTLDGRKAREFYPAEHRLPERRRLLAD